MTFDMLSNVAFCNYPDKINLVLSMSALNHNAPGLLLHLQVMSTYSNKYGFKILSS